MHAQIDSERRRAMRAGPVRRRIKAAIYRVENDGEDLGRTGRERGKPRGRPQAGVSKWRRITHAKTGQFTNPGPAAVAAARKGSDRGARVY